MDALNLGCICLFVIPGDSGDDGDPTATASPAPPALPGGATRSGVASHLASMYRCFLQGAMCMPLSRAHCFAAAHMTRTTPRSRSARPTNASGSDATSALYPAPPRAISNSPRKLGSTTTRTALPLLVGATTST
ncbi:Os05g0519350 [Oryza sativa Japonica Group]|uniref:Os05g0519350 protein n=1 Tax=Oryza sativa subsp. japonica TaxID=39947 RepID=C7J2L4_ORYSJ|nr:Os05g0519350 [Oryza sativa Japonica Group]|eukprot:NP_001174491.1 Os05g0519350 [Oryza sativa Japonica Group]